MRHLLRFGIGLACLGFSASALAQTYYDSTVSADGTDCRAFSGQAEIDDNG